jgi:hypothetical protein
VLLGLFVLLEDVPNEFLEVDLMVGEGILLRLREHLLLFSLEGLIEVFDCDQGIGRRNNLLV